MQIIRQAPLAALGMGAAFTILWGVADPVAVFAEVKVVEADGYYIMGGRPRGEPGCGQGAGESRCQAGGQ